MMVRRLAILTLVLLAVSLDAAPKGKPRSREGDYNVSVGGFARGAGSASVSGNRLKIIASVKSESGDAGELNASGLTISGNHFSGSGNVMGRQATFKGRLDAPDNDTEKTIKGVRLSCTVATADGQYLRIIGFLPPPPQAPTDDRRGDDDDDDRGRGKGKSKPLPAK